MVNCSPTFALDGYERITTFYDSIKRHEAQNGDTAIPEEDNI